MRERPGDPGLLGLGEQPLFISVVVPVKEPTPYLQRVRQRLAAAPPPVEVIFVADRGAAEALSPQAPHEKILLAERPGRGFACAQGAMHARGEAVVFLHADTIPPAGWHAAIRRALWRRSVAGGAFSLSFDDQNFYLKFLILLSDLLFRFTGELWGDRAIFVRARVLRECLPLLNVPIMEDVRLSHCMRQKGSVLMLGEKVTTSSAAFRSRGLLDHTLRILRCRLLYALGRDLAMIHKCYYPESA